MNEHANHERRCINELKRNEACPIDDANHAEDAAAADVADGVPGGIVNQPGGGGVVKWEVCRDWGFQPPQYLAKARGASASRN